MCQECEHWQAPARRIRWARTGYVATEYCLRCYRELLDAEEKTADHG